MSKLDNLKHFPKGNNANPKGRPKKLVSHTLEQLAKEGYAAVKKGEVVQVYEFLIGVDVERLKQIAQSTDLPIIYAQCAKHLLGKNGFQIMENMLDRAHGKATSNNSHEIIVPKKLPDWITGGLKDEQP